MSITAGCSVRVATLETAIPAHITGDLKRSTCHTGSRRLYHLFAVCRCSCVASLCVTSQVFSAVLALTSTSRPMLRVCKKSAMSIDARCTARLNWLKPGASSGFSLPGW